MNPRLNLIGERFRQLIVIAPHDDIDGKSSWLCQCDCGKRKVFKTTNLRWSKTKSCGCLQRHEAHNARWKGVGEISATFFSSIKCKAKLRNIEVNITIEDIWNLYLKQNKKCSLSGVDICFSTRQYGGKRLKEQTASLDRIDSSKGYTLDNIQLVHKTIQLMKNVLSQEDFIKWCKLVSKKEKSNGKQKETKRTTNQGSIRN